LQDAFEAELAAAKAVVEEPPQPKIKLKVAEKQEAAPAAGVKRITIHVANRGSSVGSPAPQPGAAAGATVQQLPSNTEVRPPAGLPAVMLGGAAAAPAAAAPQRPELIKAAPGSGPLPAPPAAIKPEVLQRTNGVGPSPLGTPNGLAGPMHSTQAFAPIPNGIPAPPPAPVTPPYDQKYRAKGKGKPHSLLRPLMQYVMLTSVTRSQRRADPELHDAHTPCSDQRQPKVQV
jgi:hypothetical protein